MEKGFDKLDEPSNQNQDLIDVASGTGDVAMIYSKKLIIGVKLYV